MIKRPFEQWLFEDVEIEFGLERIEDLPALQAWLDVPNPLPLTARLEKLCLSLRRKVEIWNEDELKMMFAYPFLAEFGLDLQDNYRIFIQNSLVRSFEFTEDWQATVLFVAQGKQKPKPPFLFLHTFCPEIQTENEKDTLGQLLIAMVEAQIMNNNPAQILYGCYNIGRIWFFVVLAGKEYGVSRAYDATQTDDLTDMVAILKKVKVYIHEQLGLPAPE